LGHLTNNQKEAMEVFMDLKLRSAEKYKEIIVIGDFELVIKGLRK
jgi:hypothetical protein